MEHCGWRRFSFKSEAGQEVELELLVELDKASADQVQTVVIACHGKERNALETLRQARQHFRHTRTLVVAPHFVSLHVRGKVRTSAIADKIVKLNGLDKDHIRAQEKVLGSTDSLLVWKGNEWGEGGPSRTPVGSQTSSFEALDALLAFHADATTFPHVQRIIVVGHSLGAQLVQRYSLLGKGLDTSASRRVDLAFVVMNPSTYLYLDESRTYKYGLAGRAACLSHYPAALLDRASIERKLGQRRVHYLHGEKDTGVGDDREQAMEQGRNRLERSRVWRDHLNALGWPALHTFGYVPNVGHDAGKMMASSQFSHIIQSYLPA